ncbi:MAG TPA: universal stress protein UspA [Clostridia bacterium]|nr:universal stress protein UspA [Clostridia bacterium]
MNVPCKTMVCVTVQKNCERLIREGSKFAQGLSHGLSVVHVAPIDAHFLGQTQDGEALEFLYRISREFGADMDVLRSDRPLDTLVEHARKIGAQCVVLGAPGELIRPGKQDLAVALQKRLPDVTVYVAP